MTEDVSVVGGGVIGLSTGAWLELAGYDTHVYTEHRVSGVAPVDAPPSVASPYAAASIIPHRDATPRAATVLETSNAVYARLAEAPTWPVRQQRHVVVHEGDPGERPWFADHLPAFRPLDPRRDPVPTRTGVAEAAVDGWSFEPYFVSGPEYLERLEGVYLSAGGAVETGRVAREEVGGLPGSVVVNATGLGARAFADDPALRAVEGQLLLVDGVAGPAHAGRPYSYNYHPQRAGSGDVGVYAYPRANELVLGGTWRSCAIEDGGWTPEPIAGPTIAIDGVDVPARLLEVNDELLESVALSRRRASVTAGLRSVREGGARVEAGDIDGTPVVHNYGHGGAGVTYAWGSAALVAERLAQRGEPTLANPPADPAAGRPVEPPRYVPDRIAELASME